MNFESISERVDGKNKKNLLLFSVHLLANLLDLMLMAGLDSFM
jgi:hypothetical protein